MKVVLISTYELGHQPFGLASPAAFLRAAGAAVTCNDLAVEPLDEHAVASAGLIAFYVPMHTATRLASAVAERATALNPDAHLCFYGLYAPMNEVLLRSLGADTLLGGEFENGLVSLYRRLEAAGNRPAGGRQTEPIISLAKQTFVVPDRSDLPPLSGYAYLDLGDGERRTVGYTEASRGCKHLCRHCPVVPVYGGTFRVVQRDVVIEDIRGQVAAGARHVTFGDPDFFNGVGHAMRLVERLHAEFPRLTYDATIKIEHLLKHAHLLPSLVETGCLFVTTAVESVDDRVLERLDKGHTRSDFIRVVGLAREANLGLSPTFIPFMPWTSVDGYRDLLGTLVELDLVDRVASIQLAIRLLIPEGSRLLDLPDLGEVIEGFDAGALSYAWRHPDPRVDRLHQEVRRTVEAGEGESRRKIFRRIWQLAHDACGMAAPPQKVSETVAAAVWAPRLSEPWYCCAEPTAEQFARV